MPACWDGGGAEVVSKQLVPWWTEHHGANDRSMPKPVDQLCHVETTPVCGGATRAERDCRRINPSSKRYQCIFQQRDERSSSGRHPIDEEAGLHRQRLETAYPYGTPLAVFLYRQIHTECVHGLPRNVQHAVLTVPDSGRLNATKYEQRSSRNIWNNFSEYETCGELRPLRPCDAGILIFNV